MELGAPKNVRREVAAVKPIETILSEAIPDLSQDVADQIVSAVRENYVTVAERDEKVRRAETYRTQVEELTAKVAELEASDETQALREKVAEFEAAEAERVAAEQAAAKRKGYEDEFAKALNGRSFVNDRTRDSVLAEAIAKREANPDMGMDKVLESITADADGLFANPQQDAGARPKQPRQGSRATASTDLTEDWKAVTAQLLGPAS